MIVAMPNFSRAWDQYLVKAVFDESAADWPARSREETRAYESNIRHGTECQLFELSTPIALASDVKEVASVAIDGKELRIYPPFPLNEKKRASGSFAEVVIPEGLAFVDNTAPIPSDAVTGVNAQHGLLPNAVWARGLRIDVEAGANVNFVIRSLLDHICQYTHQWWVIGTHNPFLGMQRLGAGVDLAYRCRQLFGYQGAVKIESPWYGMVRFQPTLGNAAILTKTIWSQIAKHISRGQQADIGVLGIHEAFADYMAGRDQKCILNLCIAIEILLNKHWQAVLKKPSNDKLEKIIRKTPLLDVETKSTLEKLIIDRGHVAHGRNPHVLATNSQYTIEKYLSVGRVVLEKYLASIPHGAWPQMMTMTINRKGTESYL